MSGAVCVTGWGSVMMQGPFVPLLISAVNDEAQKNSQDWALLFSNRFFFSPLSLCTPDDLN